MLDLLKSYLELLLYKALAVVHDQLTVPGPGQEDGPGGGSHLFKMPHPGVVLKVYY